jgi:NhaP-type Na+/H+ or K+/H+ antiporter
MDERFIVLSAALVLGYGCISALANRSAVTPPMGFMLAGLFFSPLVSGLIEMDLNSERVAGVATLALVIILCCDAAQLDRKHIRKIRALPIRLLLVGLPLTMLLGTGLAALCFPGAPVAGLALLALLLSPTDAALGQAVISSKAVPNPIREALNVESGLNDGIALPPIFIVLFLLGAALGGHAENGWGRFVLFQLALGPAVGAALGLGVGRLIERNASRGWIEEDFQRIALPAIAILSYLLAEHVGGNGFIAAFVSGFMLGVTNEDVRERMMEFGETTGTLLSLLVFLVFGLVMIPETFEHWTVQTSVYAVLSLTVVRMVPVALSVVGLGLNLNTQLFLGWFGPRGIASVLYMLLVVRYLGIEGYETLFAAGVQTVALSVLLHGVTAAPLARIYGAWAKTHTTMKNPADASGT